MGEFDLNHNRSIGLNPLKNWFLLLRLLNNNNGIVYLSCCLGIKLMEIIDIFLHGIDGGKN